MDAACDKLEAVSDAAILDAVARVPWGDGWGGSADTRMHLAERLADRRSKVREVMESW